MNSEEKLKQQVAEVAKRFFAEHMSINPESITVDIHSDCLVVTLCNAISRAEVEYTKEKLSSERLDKFYKDTFDASKLTFETAVGKIYPKEISGAFMSLNPESGKCVIVVSVCSDKAKKTQLG